MAFRRREDVLDKRTLDELIVFLMEMDAKLDRILEALGGDDVEA